MIADYYIPPKDSDKPVEHHLAVDLKKPIVHMPVVFQKDFFRLSDLLKKPTEEDFMDCAEQLKEIFADGFQWEDIAGIMNLSLRYLNAFFTLNIEETREAAISILNHLIDITDTPYLPDDFFDPIFKTLIPSFVEIVIPNSLSTILPHAKIAGIPTDDNIIEFTKDIVDSFSEGLEWSDLASLTARAVQFVNQFMDSSTEEKKQEAKEIIKNVISSTDSLNLPDFITDTVFTQIANGFIDYLVDSIPMFLR